MGTDLDDEDDLYSLDYPELAQKISAVRVGAQQHTAEVRDCQEGAIERMTYGSVAARADTDTSTAEDIPTYSNWEHRDGEYAPVQSPPSPTLAAAVPAERLAERLVFDERIRRVRQEQNVDITERENASVPEFLENMLHQREGFLVTAQQAQWQGDLYWLPQHWPRETLMQAVRHPALLNRYYELKARISENMTARRDELERVLGGGEYINVTFLDEIQTLNMWHTRGMADIKSGSHEEAMNLILDSMEQHLNDDVQRRVGEAGLVPDGEVQEIITELPEGFRWIVRELRDNGRTTLATRYEGLRQSEMNIFPGRFSGFSFSADPLSPKREKSDEPWTEGEQAEWFPSCQDDAVDELTGGVGGVSVEDFKSRW